MYKSFFVTLFVILVVQINGLRSQNSVLAEGEWYKLAIEENGIYQLSYQDFVDMGFDAANIDPRKIQIYGNVEGVLPEANNIVVPTGLIQNAIYVSGADDGSFDPDDYVAFYAQGAHTWYYEGPSEQFRYYQHPYANKNYYFITIGSEDGKRIDGKASTNETPLKTITSFKDHLSHEVNLFNFVKSGRKWFGESFEDVGEMIFDFDFPNFDKRYPVKFGIYAAGNSESVNEIIVTPHGSESQELNIPYVVGNYTYAKEGELRHYYTTTSDLVSFTLSYTPPSPNDNAWIDYIEVTAVRDLKMHEHQMNFSYNVLFNQNEVFRFKLSNANDQLKIWEVTDPYNTKAITGAQLYNDTLQFGLQLQQTHYFIAFDEEGFLKPEFVEPVINQDLKGLEPFDFLIVTVDEFLDQAERLAAFHEEFDGLRCEVVLKDKIYNEFSSGKQDPTAIRNFLRYHYNHNDSINQPKYLLLFGDASYDFKDVLPDNTNIVPVFQSKGSTALTDTYNTDDYYGIMGQLDGDSSLGEINISIGRFPVRNLDEAKVMVDKTISYASNLKETMGDWRNKVCFIADDEDSNLHFKDSNRLADTFMLTHPEFNVDKIFLDSYVQEETSNGDRYPDVTEAISNGVADGTLFFNYTGHGGHIALTDERVLQIPDILSWENYDKLGVWIVASCEFGPFDNPEHTSAGEHLVLNPNGGGVALFTTTRLAYASYNFRLNEKFHEIAFSRRADGSHYRLGDIIRYAKNESGNKEKNLNFVLLGDPALKMAYPEYHVETTQMNGVDVNTDVLDTIKARQTVNVKAKVTDLEHQILSSFNGLVYYKVYAKPSTYSTLANDPKSYKAEFDIVDQMIHQGVARASSGEFEFSFVVPTNISSLYGLGKISYYALEEQSDKTYIDANGGFIDFIIGGVDESIALDTQGPEIAVYLDNYHFKNGGKSSTKPLMLINLFDESGINTVNLGFGKEIKATVDNQDQYYLNDFYSPVDYSYQEGKIQYQLDELSYGTHHLNVKAWDSFDNSSEKSIQFIVVSEERIDIYDLMNQPNPAVDFTQISFMHNQTEEPDLKVFLRVYDIYGRLVWTYEDQVVVLGNSIEPIRFGPSDSRLTELNSGIYSYVIEVSNSDGQKVKGKQKMMIVK
jgi:hypothetical protein